MGDRDENDARNRNIFGDHHSWKNSITLIKGYYTHLISGIVTPGRDLLIGPSVGRSSPHVWGWFFFCLSIDVIDLSVLFSSSYCCWQACTVSPIFHKGSLALLKSFFFGDEHRAVADPSPHKVLAVLGVPSCYKSFQTMVGEWSMVESCRVYGL